MTLPWQHVIRVYCTYNITRTKKGGSITCTFNNVSVVILFVSAGCDVSRCVPTSPSGARS